MPDRVKSDKTCFLLVGIPGCGKSTITQRIIEQLGLKNADVRIMSQDWCYRAFTDASHAGQWWSDHDDDKTMYAYCFQYAQAHEKEFTAFVDERWKWVLQGEYIFIDRTNRNKKARARYIQEARAKGFSIWAIDIHVPLQVCIDRQKTRTDHELTPELVREMYFQKQEILLGTEADFLMHVDGTEVNPNLAGTLHLHWFLHGKP